MNGHCARCGAQFHGIHRDRMYCSISCKSAACLDRRGKSTFGIVIDSEARAWLDSRSSQWNCSISDIISQALDEYREAVEENEEVAAS